MSAHLPKWMERWVLHCCTAPAQDKKTCMLNVLIPALSVVNPPPATYLSPGKLLLNDFIVWLHVTGKFQITDGVLVAAVDALENTVCGFSSVTFTMDNLPKNCII